MGINQVVDDADRRIAAMARARARRKAAKKLRQVKRFAQQQEKLMLRKLAMLDQKTKDQAKGVSSSVILQAETTMAKAALEQLSQLEQKVEEAVMLTAEGEVIAK